MDPRSTITQEISSRSLGRNSEGVSATDPVVRQERLARILDDYLVAIEQGQQISPEDLLAQYPEDAAQLRGYLSGLNLFHAAANDPARSLLGSVEPETGIPPALRTIGDYRLVREIGHGGMGVVYEAWQVSLRRRVALKVLPFTSSRDAKQIGRFKNEAQAAAQVQHPNIVPVFAVGEENGVHYYVMQLIEGQSLTSLLAALRTGSDAPCGTTAKNNALTYNTQRAAAYLEPQPPATEKILPMRAGETADHICVVARLGIQAAEALHAAHEYGVVHRDVKPSNLLLDDQGKLWVTDFGLARCRDEKGLTQTGDILGTMRYMSPEQARGNAALVDQRTDIYSLGLTMYELATLHHPADEAGEAQMLLERDRPAPKPLRHWNRHIPHDFQTIVLKCLAEQPVERYSSAKELAEDLERYLDGRPILASPPSVISRLGKWAKRRRGVVYAAAAVLLVAGGAGLMISHERFTASQRALGQTQKFLRVLSDVGPLNPRYVKELSGVPGTESVRLEMLKNSLAYHEKFLRETVNEPLFAADAALTQTRIGELHRELGERGESRDAYTKAKDAFEAFLRREPDNVEFNDNLAQTLNGLALLGVDEDRLKEARELLSRAAGLQSQLVANDPTSNELVVHLANTHNNLGLVELKLHDRDAAAQEFRAAIELLEPLAQDAANDEARRGLAASYNSLASLEKLSDIRAADATYQKAIALERELVKTAPTNRKHQSELALAYNNLGYVASKNKDWKKAESCYTNAIELQTNLVKSSPQIVSYRSDLAISYNNLGMAQIRTNRLGEADASFNQAVELQDELLKSAPADAQTLSDQGSVWNNIGMLHDRRNQLAEAASAYQLAIKLQLSAIKESENNETYRDMLSRHYFNYCRNLAAQGKFEEAVKIAGQRKQLWPGEAERLFSIGRELADMERQMAGKPGTDSARTAAAQVAVAALREAVDAGLPAERLQDASLSVLSESSEFRQLLEEHQRSASTPAATGQVELSRVN